VFVDEGEDGIFRLEVNAMAFLKGRVQPSGVRMPALPVAVPSALPLPLGPVFGMFTHLTA